MSNTLSSPEFFSKEQRRAELRGSIAYRVQSLIFGKELPEVLAGLRVDAEAGQQPGLLLEESRWVSTSCDWAPGIEDFEKVDDETI